MKLPKKYEWLLAEPGPKMVLEFLKIYGVTETPGEGDNPTIVNWAKEVGLHKIYRHDATAWCGLEMAVIAKRAGKAIPKDPLWALNWARFGVNATDGAKLGDVLVFKRSGGGHVGLYVGEDDECYHVGGGNQGDQSNIIRITKNRLYAIRRPVYVNQPANIRKIQLSAEGEISSNES